MNLYIGNLSYRSTEAGLRELFEQYGRVDAVRIISDKVTNRSRGFGFVEMPTAAEAQAAIRALDGHDMEGRALRVNEAQPRQERSDRPRR